MNGLEACPFCRELFPQGEVKVCPECDVAVVPYKKLPPRVEEEMAVPQLDTQLSWLHWGNGRGLLIGLSVLGLAAFGAPWVSMTRPETALLSGMNIAERSPFMWSAGVAWFVLLPLVLSRKTLRQMIGAKIIAAVFCLLPVIDTLLLLTHPPRAMVAGNLRVTIDSSFSWGIYLTLALGVVGVYVALFRFGNFAMPEEATSAS